MNALQPELQACQKCEMPPSASPAEERKCYTQGEKKLGILSEQ